MLLRRSTCKIAGHRGEDGWPQGRRLLGAGGKNAGRRGEIVGRRGGAASQQTIRVKVTSPNQSTFAQINLKLQSNSFCCIADDAIIFELGGDSFGKNIEKFIIKIIRSNDVQNQPLDNTFCNH